MHMRLFISVFFVLFWNSYPDPYSGPQPDRVPLRQLGGQLRGRQHAGAAGSRLAQPQSQNWQAAATAPPPPPQPQPCPPCTLFQSPPFPAGPKPVPSLQRRTEPQSLAMRLRQEGETGLPRRRPVARRQPAQPAQPHIARHRCDGAWGPSRCHPGRSGQPHWPQTDRKDGGKRHHVGTLAVPYIKAQCVAVENISWHQMLEDKDRCIFFSIRK